VTCTSAAPPVTVAEPTVSPASVTTTCPAASAGATETSRVKARPAVGVDSGPVRVVLVATGGAVSAATVSVAVASAPEERPTARIV
jgi:hypothetical protein